MLDSGDIQENSQKKRHEMILKKDVAEFDDIKPAGGPGMMAEYKK